MIENITSVSNPKIKFAINLQQKKYRDKNELFLLEGIRNAEMALVQKADIDMCFCTQKALDNERTQRLVDELTCPIYLVPDNIYQKISDTVSPQGFMLVVKYQKINLDTFFATDKNGLYLILDRLQDPGNLGTIIRTADAMGINGIICLNGTADIYSPKVVRSAMGSLFNIHIINKISETDLLTLTAKNNIKLYATALDDSAKPCWHINYPKNCAIILGNEANGVSETLLTKCTEKIYIPMQGNAESLNVANAGAMIMYEYCRQNI